MSKLFSETVCKYYGRLFLEMYEQSGGKTSVPTALISNEMEDIVCYAAVCAAKSPVVNPSQIRQAVSVCSCDYFAHECRFLGMLLKFNCPVHGEVTLDRKVVWNPIYTGTGVVTTPTPPYTPYTRYVPPTWPDKLDELTVQSPNTPTFSPTITSQCETVNSTAFESMSQSSNGSSAYGWENVEG